MYTDGACSGTPGPGGWAWAVPDGPYASGRRAAHDQPAHGDHRPRSRRCARLDGPLEVVSDSTYVVNCFRDRWWEGWLRAGLAQQGEEAGGQPRPVGAAHRRCTAPTAATCTFRWVKGHSGDPMNDLVDRLAVEAAPTQQGRSGRPARRPTSGPADAVAPARRRRPALPDGPPAASSAGLRPPELGGYDDNPVADGVRAELAEILRGQARAARRPRRAHRPRARRRAARRRGGRGRRRALRRRAAVPRPRRGVARRRPGAASRELLAGARRGRACCRRSAPDDQAAGGRRARPARRLAGPPRATRRSSCGTATTPRVGKLVRVARRTTWATTIWVPRARRRRTSAAMRAASTPAARSPTSSPTTAASPRCSSTPDDPAAVRSRRRRCSAPAVRRCSPTAPRWPPTPCSSGGARRVALVTNAGLRRRDRDRPPGPAVAVRPVRRPARAARAARAPARGRAAGSTPTVASSSRSTSPLPPLARRRRGGRGLPAARRPRPAPRAGGRPTRSRRAAIDVTLLARGVARSSASTSARSPRSSTPTCGPRAARYLRGLGDARRRGAGDDVGRRAGARRPRPPSCPPRCCCRARPAACGPRRAAAAAAGFPDAVTFDMGGTSTDVCLVSAARPSPPPSARSAGFPVRLPVARRPHHRRRRRLDRPHRRRRRARRRARRARAPIPGPACYGRGGDRADGHRRRPRRSAASPPTPRSPVSARSTAAPPRRALARRRRRPPRAWSRSSTPRWSRRCAPVTVERGVDPRGLALVAFGGAGPLHACALAEALGMAAVIVPPARGRAVGRRAAVLARASATSCARGRRPATTTGSTPRSPSSAPRRSAVGRARRDGRRRRARLPLRGPEPRAHRGRRSTTSTPSTGGATATPGRTRPSRWSRCGPAPGAAPPLDVADLPAPSRERRAVVGPAVIAEPDCTVWVPDGLAGRRRHERQASWILRRSRS